MHCNKEACAECTGNCVLIHGKKKDPSPIVTSFFKVMIGDNFSKLLFLPPRFAQKVRHLVEKKIPLEDANGQRWEVTVSRINGSLGFKRGWHEFSLDHRLEVGDFLVFYYIVESHFVVHIWGKSGCEKIKFSPKNGHLKKRIKTGNISAEETAFLWTNEVNLINKQGPSSSVIAEIDIKSRQRQQQTVDKTSNSETENGKFGLASRTEYIEEPFYMFNRDFDGQGEDRLQLYDLSIFEMPKSRSDTDGQNEGKEPILVEDLPKSYNLGVTDTKTEYEVKASPTDSVDLSVPDASRASLSVVIGTLNFVELPTSLPGLFRSRGMKLNDKVVFLRDQKARLWPVFYQEMHGMKALTSGWKAFSMANGIQQGDKCVFFDVGNGSECIYDVNVVRK